MAADEVVSGGYYLEQIESKVGTGDTAKNATMENLWQAKIAENGAIKMELLDNNNLPSGYAETVPPEEIDQRFVYQPGFKPRVVDPKAEQADKISARAQRHLEEKQYNSAEFEFQNAVRLDEENVRANFGLGQTYVEMGDTQKAKEVFNKLSKIEAVLEPENKHIFNECGINLRKLGMYPEAVDYYRRALGLVKNDENLWFNLARALIEGGQKDKGVAALKKSLQLNPKLETAKLYLKSVLAG